MSRARADRGLMYVRGWGDAEARRNAGLKRTLFQGRLEPRSMAEVLDEIAPVGSGCWWCRLKRWLRR